MALGVLAFKSLLPPSRLSPSPSPSHLLTLPLIHPSIHSSLPSPPLSRTYPSRDTTNAPSRSRTIEEENRRIGSRPGHVTSRHNTARRGQHEGLQTQYATNRIENRESRVGGLCGAKEQEDRDRDRDRDTKLRKV